MLPAIGITVKKVPTELIAGLTNRGSNFQLAISTITIFELCAKSAKLVAADMLRLERVSRGVAGLLKDDALTKYDSYGAPQLSVALKLRSLLDDFIDCLILATAMVHCDVLITEDNRIHGLKRKEEFAKLANSLNNPKFTIRRLAEV